MKKMFFILGGTMGHISPAFTINDALKNELKYNNIDIKFVGGNKGIEQQIFNEYKIKNGEYYIIPSAPFPRKINLKIFIFIIKFIHSLISSLRIIHKEKPNIIIGFGSYITVPIFLIAKIYPKKIDLHIHESNVIPGLANKLLYYISHNVTTSAIQSQFKKIKYVKPILPLYYFIKNNNNNINKYKDKFNLKSNLFTILIFAGSQGSTIINNTIWDSVDIFEKHNIQILHIIGIRHKTKDINSQLYKQISYCKNMFEAYNASDFVICRGGAFSCDELFSLNKPALFIPFTIGNKEQYENIKLYIKHKASLMIDENKFTKIYIEQLLPNIKIKQREMQSNLIQLKNNLNIDTRINYIDIIKKII